MQKGYTLAEVLITLGVIGVVAVIIMPNLIKNHQKAVTINKLKVEYSKFANIILKSVSENGNISDWIEEFKDISDLREKSALITEKYILPYIDGQSQKLGRYQYQVWSLDGQHSFFYYFVSGTPYRIKNGTVFDISIREISGSRYELILLLDIDNKIQKNIIGKDVFMFSVDTYNNNNTLKVYGSGIPRDYLTGNDTNWVCRPPKCNVITYPLMSGGCTNSISDRYAGTYCTALIDYDGWKISDDYPW